MGNFEKPEKPEREILEQFLKVFEEEYGYPQEYIQVEFLLNLGRRTVGIDAAVFQDMHDKDPYILIEVKREIALPISADQLKTYLGLSPARYALLTDGTKKLVFRKIRHDLVTRIPDLPHKDLPESSIYTKDNLDKPTNLERLFWRIMDHIRKDEGLDPKDAFDEFYKIIFAKLVDEERLDPKCDFRVEMEELLGIERQKRIQDIFVTRINNLLEQAARKYPDLISRKSVINLKSKTLVAVVSELQSYSFGKISGDVIGLLYEKAIEPIFEGDTEHRYAPKELVECVIEMLDPQIDEAVIDPACGSGSFLIECIKAVQEKIDSIYPSKLREKMKKAYSQNNVFGVDISEQAARIARMNLFMHGGGNVYCMDSLLGPTKFAETMQRTMRGFDIVICDPPKRLNISDREILSSYRLARGKKSQDILILFLELCISLTNPGGRIGIILPNTVLTKASLRYVREFLREQARIKSIITLPSSLFKPYTSLAESFLLLEKKERPSKKLEDYTILMSIVKRSGHLSDVVREFNTLKRYPQWVKYETTKEISLFTLSSLKLRSRMDPEYYRPEYSIYEKELSKYPAQNLGKIAAVTAGISIPSKMYQAEGIPYIRISDIAEGRICPTRFIRIPQDKRDAFEKGRLKGGESLLSKVGTIGKVAIVPEHLKGAVVSSNLAIVRLNVDAPISIFYLYHMLSSDLIALQLQRMTTGAVIRKVNLRDLKQIRIPILPKQMQKQFEKKARASFKRCYIRRKKADQTKGEESG